MTDEERSFGMGIALESPQYGLERHESGGGLHGKIYDAVHSAEARALVRKARDRQDIQLHDSNVRTLLPRLSDIVHDIRNKHGGGDSEAEGLLPKVARDVIESPTMDDVEPKEIPTLLVLLEKTEGNPLLTAEQIAEVIKAISDVDEPDSGLSKKIMRKLLERAREKGVRREDLYRMLQDMGVRRENIDRYFREAVETLGSVDAAQRGTSYKDEMRELAPYFGIAEGILTIMPSADFILRLHREAEAGVTGVHSGNNIADLPEIREVRVDREIESRRTRLFNAYTDVLSCVSGDFDEDRRNFDRVLNELRSEGFIDGAEAARFSDSLDEYRRKTRGLEGSIDAAGTPSFRPELFLRSAREAGVDFSPDDEDIITALQSRATIAQLFRDKYLTDPSSGNPVDPKDAWKRFENDMTSVFETVLSVADRNPSVPHSEAHSTYYEGRVYNQLIAQLSNIGLSGDSTGLEVTITEVVFKTLDQDYGPNPTRIGNPKDKYAERVDRNVSFESAVGSYLHSKMIDLRKRSKIFHDINYIIDRGAGFEELAKIIDQLTTADLDEMYEDDPYLSLAVKYYLQSLAREIAINDHTIPTDFGLRDRKDGLDSVQRRAYNLLLQQYARETGRPIDEGTRRKVKRKIRMATGIAQGGTGEFWGIVLGARVLVLSEDEEGRGKTKNIFRGSHSKGFERMIFDLDPMLLFERFGDPGYNQAVRHVYHARDIGRSKPAWREMYDHANVYHRRKQYEHALAHGRTDDFADFDDENIMLQESGRHSFADIQQRSGWRYDQERKLWVPRGSSEWVERSIINLHKVAPFLVKRFIDAQFKAAGKGESICFDRDYIKRVQDLGYGPIAARMTTALAQYERAKGKDRKRDAEEAYKEIIYEYEIYRRLAEQESVQFVVNERKRVMPAHELEEGKNVSLRDGLFKYLRMDAEVGGVKVFNGMRPSDVQFQVMDMFLSAIELAQTMRMEQAKRSHDRTGIRGDMEYRFTDADFDSADIRAAVLGYFTEQLSSEMIPIPGGATAEQLMVTLKGFYGEMERLIALPRTSRKSSRNRNYRSETLLQRHARLLVRNMGYASNDLESVRFDRSRFNLSTGGARMVGRMMGEAAASKKVSDALKKLLLEVLPEVVQSEDVNAAAKKLADAVAEIAKPIGDIDSEGGDAKVESLILLINRLIGTDQAFRLEIFGSILKDFTHRYKGREDSLLKDYFVNRFGRPTKSFNSGEMLTIFNAIVERVNLAWERKRIEGYSTPESRKAECEARADEFRKKAEEALDEGGFFNELKARFYGIQARHFAEAVEKGESLWRRTLGKVPFIGPFVSAGFDTLRTETQFGENKHSFERLRKTLGLDNASRLFENSPYLAAMLIALLIALFMGAKEANKKASGGGS